MPLSLQGFCALTSINLLFWQTTFKERDPAWSLTSLGMKCWSPLFRGSLVQSLEPILIHIAQSKLITSAVKIQCLQISRQKL